jgi:rhodanese-related sulfurtransferase
MSTRVDALEAETLLRRGTLLVDVLPPDIFRDEHLPGAINVPLETFAPDQVEHFDRSVDLVVYCFDQH